MANQLLSVWGTIGSVLLAILLLLIMITIHEFGHYVAGKILHFKIDEFSIGFGPALFKRKSKKTGELFAVRLVPLGGYCAFAGEDGLEEDDKKKKDEKEPFPEIAETEFSKEETAEPAESETEGKEEDKSGYFTNRKPWQRIIVLFAGAFMNYVLALILIVTLFFAYGQTMYAVYEAEPLTAEDIAAEGYCLQDRDIMLKADGKNLYLTTDIARAVNGKKKGDKVTFYISRVIVDETGIDEETGEETIVKSHREEMNVEVMMRADVKVKNSADLDCVWKALGVKEEFVQDAETGEEKSAGFMLASASYHYGFFETIGRSFVYSFKIAGSIFKVLGELLTGHLGISALGGPVTTIAMTSQIAARSFRGFLEIACFIGVNLAVFNLLPIPALDGSKIVFTVIEWVRGKPISRKVEAIIHAVGFILLLGFAVLVDILQFVL